MNCKANCSKTNGDVRFLDSEELIPPCFWIDKIPDYGIDISESRVFVYRKLLNSKCGCGNLVAIPEPKTKYIDWMDLKRELLSHRKHCPKCDCWNYLHFPKLTNWCPRCQISWKAFDVDDGFVSVHPSTSQNWNNIVKWMRDQW